MSRVGLMPVDVPAGVDVKIEDRRVTAKGKLGELSLTLVDEIDLVREDNKLIVSPKNETKRARELWGTSRSLLANIVQGVDQGFTIVLEIIGVGYNAQVQGKKLVLQIGFCHPVEMAIPQGLELEVPSPTSITITGVDKQLVGEFAAVVRRVRPPEPYKGKGIRYENEQVKLKAGKAFTSGD